MIEDSEEAEAYAITLALRTVYIVRKCPIVQLNIGDALGKLFNVQVQHRNWCWNYSGVAP